MIRAVDASLIYRDGTQALKPFNLMVEKGETLYITGPSGSGKTSLLKLLMGIEFASTGTLEVLGQSMTHREEGAIRAMRKRIGPVFQDFRLMEGRSVYENVVLGMRFLDLSAADMKRQAEESILRVGLEHKGRQSVDNLSWGECQRVTIARAVARRPELIIADEPTGNLDQDNALQILRLLTSFGDANTTVVITTHATHLLSMVPAGRHLAMASGHLLQPSKERGGRP
ncbi:cell division ATP-binding protein FtsE [Acidaminobacter hydrogenoformans]|uniref:Cell division transport system ATP-binding protein n=1 Tax=Acidaminobacter hydrogenoformans DSM 2784 TaxID=1120920 RepID=A0A1G5RVJ9_9FIRM|nr:ATP-binding cassette domain-containing protein [Acidaminobacter hydrogenoformans]SCZ78165.1 cell division transport system ATP-binding protein [Acidaminobacter hydrogenoformans DSM 2784]